MTRLRRLLTAMLLPLAGGAACSAIVGVEDVHLAPTTDGSAENDTGTDGRVDGSAIPKASVELALGFIHTCARKVSTGTILCWGDDGAGELGNGVPIDGGTRPPALVPQNVVNVSHAAALAAGATHACAILQDGTVVCWGNNFFGQLGDGTNTSSATPVAVKNVTGAVAIAAGTSFTCAILAAGSVQCWGANYSGQLGDGTKVDRSLAAPVTRLTGATGIAAGERHACAVVAGGATCWGDNVHGQLGNGTVAESLAPTPISSLTGVAQVVAASTFTCARQGSGSVYCWGSNAVGELGNGSPNPNPNPSPTNTGVADAVAIWVGYEHGCAARENGEAVCWGAAGAGQLGSGTVSSDANRPSPTTVIGVASALAVATGGTHSCATTTDGRVYCWGQNALGQVGNGTKDNAYTAVAIGGFP